MDTFTLGGDLQVQRLVFGAMRITGEGIWGPPVRHRLKELQDEDKIRHIGVSNVSAEELEQARAVVDVVSGAEPLQALAWLLARSPVMLPIPGTSSIEHLQENVAAAQIELSPSEMEEIGSASHG